MTANSKPTYGVALVLVALLIVSVTASAYYYYEYNQVRQSKDNYVSELVTATNQYNQLASNYNSSLSLINKTLSLLVGAVAVVNTSLPIYAQASTELSQLWSEYLSLSPAKSSFYRVDVLIDFGNGTQHWYNGTQVQPGWNMYVTTVLVSNGNLQAQWYPEYQEHLVSGIDGVSNSNSMYWFLWTYNSTASWQVAQVGADNLPAYNGSVYAWTYCGVTPSYAPTCVP
ncbi:MAG: hypothetical protein JRN34_00480 [Nitrososphaerota archaeon]|nr:hypothetical protein [Nitrososphaerota archaeon]MDG6943119.1 hypothetical protein [Nitrososphaerota archaeon]MDG6951003.1 hypothetical protein [Nitrososphaerota archaeon]